MPINVNEIRKDFPIFQRETRPGIPLVYLDSTATSQKPLAVIEAMNTFYRCSNANIHRGVHTLAEESTALYEQARVKIAKFINAHSADRKSTRLNSSHGYISYAVFCLKKKTNT